MSARVDQAAAFLAARPRPTGEDWEREAWRRQLTKLIIDVEWSDQEARALATRLSPEAAASLELWHAVLTPALRAALEVAHPLDDAQRAQREAEVLEEALRTGALTEAQLHEAAPTTVVALLEATQFDLFGHCATVLTLLEPARELDGLPRRVAELRESLAGRRTSLDVERALEEALEFEWDERSDPVGAAQGRVAWVESLAPAVRAWAWRTITRLAPTQRFCGFVLAART